MSENILNRIADKIKELVFLGLHGKDIQLELEATKNNLEASRTEYDRILAELNRANTEINKANDQLERAHEAINIGNEDRVRLRDLYLTLMESCLTGIIYEDTPITVLGQEEYKAELREYGWDWPSKAHTMIGSKRLKNVRNLVESVIGRDIPGDFIETGVWRGGACIMVQAVLKAYRIENRNVWLADSFEGLPVPNIEEYPDDEGELFHTFEALSVSLEEVKENFRKYRLLDDNVRFLEGWFKDTLPGAPIDKLALIRLDGDLYESTIQPLNVLYDMLSDGGYVIVDDYHVVKGCKAAIHDFFSERGIGPELEEIDGVGVYWRK